MLHFVFTVLLMLLPAVASFSGMAMTPALLIFALLAFWLVPNADKRSPLASLPNHRMLLLGIALLLVWPVVTSLWSILPLYSLGIGLRALVLATFGLLAIAYAPSIEAPAARVLFLKRA